MTTTDRTKMPTDAMMGRVVAEWKGWQYQIRFEHGTPAFIDIGGCPRWRAPLRDMTGDVEVDFINDPRTDTNAALDLLHWLVNRTQGIGFWWKPKSWVFDLPTGNIDVPISGQPMRTAVCWLAAEVLGVTETVEGE